MVPVECVARGYLTGSGLLEYDESRTVCGLALPEGLVDGSELPAPIFTPATKAAVGEHDENVSYEEVARQVGAETAAQLRQTTLAVYAPGPGHRPRPRASSWPTPSSSSASTGTTLVIADEVLTPDSSRFWPADQWEPGRAQPSYDKQFVRDWLTSAASGWDRTRRAAAAGAARRRSSSVTRASYVEAYERLTGTPWSRPVPGGLRDRPAPRYDEGPGRVTGAFACWSGRRDSNSRPSPWQGYALPTELRPQGVVTLYPMPCAGRKRIWDRGGRGRDSGGGDVGTERRRGRGDRGKANSRDGVNAQPGADTTKAPVVVTGAFVLLERTTRFELATLTLAR